MSRIDRWRAVARVVVAAALLVGVAGADGSDDPLGAVLPALRAAGVAVPIMLPPDLDLAPGDPPVYAVVERADAGSYALLLGFTPDCGGGNACRLGAVRAEPDDPTSPPAGAPVELVGSRTGYVADAACAASCGDATVTWIDAGTRYTIELKARDQATMARVADAALTAGPR